MNPTDSPPRAVPSAGRLLRGELRAVRLTAAGALLAVIAAVGAALAGPFLIRQFVDRASTGATARALVGTALAYLATALAGTIARVPSGYFAARTGWTVADSLRRRLLQRLVVDDPILRVERRQAGALLEQVEGNSDIVGKAISEALFRMIGNIVALVGTLAVMLVVVPAAALGMTVFIVLMFLAFSRLTRWAVRRWEAARTSQTELFGFLGDALAARDDVVPLNGSRWVRGQTADRLGALFSVERRAYLAGRSFWPLTQLFFACSFALVLGFGLHGLGVGGLTVGTLTMLYLYVDLLQEPLEEVSSQADELQRMMAVLGLTARTLGEEPIAAHRDGTVLPDGLPAVEFTDVTFGYDGTPVLSDVSFTVQGGRSLGVIGPTGAGKSTVVNLICGLAAPQRGSVRIAGTEASLIPPAELARHLTVLSQRAHLFAASVRDNVSLFDPAVPDDHIWSVLERLGAAGWVRALPDGLGTTVGHGGRELSEGETQLLAGARVLLRPAGLLVIDEGTSRLDPATERVWTGVVDTLMADRTVIMIAHRLATLRRVDQVLLLREGRVADLMPASHLETLDADAGVAR